MGKKALPGVDDLKTLHPSIASEADGWDSSLFLPSSNKRLAWKCQMHGHPWIATPNDRVGNEKRKGTNCPFCANRRVWKGFNDLKSKFPKVAAEADGWDPEEIVFGSAKKLPWKCEKYGHSWSALVVNRTKDKNPTGCPYCANQKLLVGFNDLTTRHPSIAAEADGWDPSKVLAGTNKKKKWRCKKHGHPFQQEINNRIRLNTGCPYCANYWVLEGFNDLKTTHPALAKQAHDWDPSTVVAGTDKMKKWICDKGHIWEAVVVSRSRNGNDCPVCAGQMVWRGYNDLQTRCPELAKEANGWDPSEVMPGAHEPRSWKCEKGHTWDAAPYSRTGGNKTGCPDCADYGFNPSEPAWFYLMARPGEQQIGITNNLGKRVRTHEKYGWSLIESSSQNLGHDVQKTETEVKQWLRQNVEIIPGTSENWFTASMEIEIASLDELKNKSNIETEVF